MTGFLRCRGTDSGTACILPAGPAEWIMLGLLLAGLAGVGVVLWRNPVLRHELIKRYHPDAIGKRMQDWAERNRR